MALKLRISSAERSCCCIAILISVSSATLRAQTSGEIDAHLFSIATPSLSLCGQPADECSPDSAAVPPQQGSSQSGSSQSNAGGSNSYQNDWVHSWLRKVDQVRANQPHFVSPIVTTHVLLVQQFRYDMSWQQDPTGGTVTSNYGAGRGLEIIPTTRLEVGIFPPSYFVHQSKTPDGYRPVPHFRSGERPGSGGHSKHDWRKSSNQWDEYSGPHHCLQYRRQLQD